MSRRNLGDNGQIKIGAILSYLLIIVNSLSGLFLTPFLIGSLGEAEYGVYKTISSLTASLMVLDLGMGGTVIRYISTYRASKEDHKIPNFIAMMLIQAGVLCGVVLIAGMCLYGGIGPMYANTFSYAQITKAKSLYIVLLVNMALHMFENVLNGTITGYNHMAFIKGVSLSKVLLRCGLMLLFAAIFKDALVVVLVDLVLMSLTIMIELVYLLGGLKVKIKLTSWEKSLFLESGKYTILMFLTSIAAQVNNNLDNVLIGAMCGAEYVTVYSVGLMLFAMYEHLSTSISGVMLPTVTKLLHQDNGEEKVQALVVRAGRIQFLLLGAAVLGFACVGKDFLSLWLGNEFSDVYIIALILMIPSLLELCVNVCLSILRAKNLLGFRTGVLFASTALNAVVTVVAIKCWSYIGAAIGTAASFVVGSVIVMNIYYSKKLKLPMLKIYGKIFERVWICLLLAGGALFVSSRFIRGSIGALITNILVFCVIYGVLLWLYGLDKAEKKHIPILNRFVKQ